MAFGSSVAAPSAATKPEPAGARDAIARFGDVETYAVGQTLLSKGARNEFLYLIENGEIDVVRDAATPVRCGPGALFGENGFLTDEEPATVVAHTSIRVRRISRDALTSALAQNPKTLHSLLDEIKQLQRERESEDAQPSAESFTAELAKESLMHRAVRHRYLDHLGSGDLPDLQWALRDFAAQYYGYSRHFPRYLTTVISRLDHPDHRSALLENLTEESGSYEDDELALLNELGVESEWFVGQPHPVLFRRFAKAMGVDTTALEEADQVVCWREMFVDILRNGSPAEAVGALGLGTENIVSTIYRPFVDAIKKLDIEPRDSVFFVLHTLIDDDHQEVLQRIASSFAHTHTGRVELRRGMLKALQCRAAFWDWLLDRALDPEQAKSVL